MAVLAKVVLQVNPFLLRVASTYLTKTDSKIFTYLWNSEKWITKQESTAPKLSFETSEFHLQKTVEAQFITHKFVPRNGFKKRQIASYSTTPQHGGVYLKCALFRAYAEFRFTYLITAVVVKSQLTGPGHISAWLLIRCWLWLTFLVTVILEKPSKYSSARAFYVDTWQRGKEFEVALKAFTDRLQKKNRRVNLPFFFRDRRTTPGESL